MEKTIKLVLSAGMIAMTVSVTNPASATPTALSLQFRQGQASAALMEPVGYYRRGTAATPIGIGLIIDHTPIGPTTVPTPTMALPTGPVMACARARVAFDVLLRSSPKGLRSSTRGPPEGPRLRGLF